MLPQVSSFFELAALLIPVLLLSGYATNRLRPAGSTSFVLSIVRRTRWREDVVALVVVTLFGGLPALAELAALDATMNGGIASEGETWLVASAVAFGMWSLAGAVVWPWLRQVWSAGPMLKRVISLGALVPLLLTGYGLHGGVESQRLLARLERMHVYDGTLLAQSQAQEAVLRDQLERLDSLGVTHGKLRTDVERQVTQLLENGNDLLLSQVDTDSP